MYNKSFERGRIADLIEDFPPYTKPLEAITGRMVDLMKPFQEQWYYEPQFNGSYSIKKVLPALVPGLSYESLDISKGDQASLEYRERVLGKSMGDWKKVEKQLLEYCKMDTLAMVKIWEALKEKV